ncbi:glycosyl transferase, family 2 [Desulforamulus reducens MI-1]|uniref:Glycosyl transferase, family 2 n=1 Tax=Desulforamulus reducens (strain ATCC BAA-1160 / DSM 100696 / MI-1) TaxID=349161 RepID=A4J4B2_DESRM|nr:glycosyltransferase [Desulforamulus reducens]ABO49915.1 glycosyl transferase, family 2 [Desulforamulus reducens MI-1]
MAKTISLCIIAKDEEQNIARCINSAKDYVDQIIVVDTGSTDYTVELAEELGAEVYHFIWQDDFALARNKSLEHATGDWILFLDCDEELDPDTAPLLKGVIENENFNGYSLKIINMFNNQPGTRFLGFRMFRNSPLHRFECPIHEQILPSVIRNSSRDKIGQSDITIYHYGYDIDEAANKNKIERNLRILHKAHQDYGNTGFIPFYIAVEHQKMGDYQKALDYYTLSLGRSDINENYVPSMIRSMVTCYINLQQYQEGLDFADKFLKVFPNYTDLVYLKGILYSHLDNIPQALECMNQCIAMGPPPINLFSVHGIADEKPKSFIQNITEGLIRQGLELFIQGNKAQAYTALDTAFQQLKKTPDEECYTQMIETMISFL